MATEQPAQRRRSAQPHLSKTVQKKDTKAVKVKSKPRNEYDKMLAEANRKMMNILGLDSNRDLPTNKAYTAKKHEQMQLSKFDQLILSKYRSKQATKGRPPQITR